MGGNGSAVAVSGFPPIERDTEKSAARAATQAGILTSHEPGLYTCGSGQGRGKILFSDLVFSAFEKICHRSVQEKKTNENQEERL